MELEQRSRRSRPFAWIAAALSLLVHAGVWTSMPAPHRHRRLVPPHAVEVSFEIDAPLAPTTSESHPTTPNTSAVPAAALDRLATTSHRARSSQETSASSVAIATTPSTPAGRSPSASGTGEVPDASCPAPAVRIDPAAVAALASRDGLLGNIDAPSTPSARPSLAATVTQDLRSIAMARPQNSRRPPPELVARPDGTLVWQGPVFHASIARDGTVRFDDAPPVTAGLHGLGVAGTFDLNDALQRAAGQDPLRAERDWFMRETVAVREQRAEQAAREDYAHSLHALEARLFRIARDTDAPLSQRHDRIFALWDDCATGALGDPARTLIAEFVRRELPMGSPLAFTPGELARLNASRSPGVPAFDPYRV